MAAILKIDRTS